MIIAAVLGGYAFAFAAATAAVHFFGAPKDASDGMAAFGDAILFLGVFGLIALATTALAIYSLWRRRRTITRS